MSTPAMPEHLRRLLDPNDTCVQEIYAMTHPRTYFALESLPELIGERQFKMLCEALGIDETMAEARVMRSDRFNPGEFAAKAIQRASEHRRHERRQRQEALEADLLGETQL